MPLYDFRCTACQRVFEELVKQEDVPVCPACGAGNPVRLDSFTAAVSTEASRARATSAARQKAGATKREKDRAHQEYVRRHMDDHH